MDAFQAARAQAAAVRTGGVGIEINLPAIPLFVPDAAKAVLNSLALQTMRLALQYAAGQFSERAPVDQGHLAQSFGSDPATGDGGIEILGTNLDTEVTGRVFSSLPWAIVMDQGRRPGAPISREGIDAIGLWAQRKLGLSADEAARAKWAIAYGIIAQGIEGTGYADAAIGASIPTVEQLFQALGDAVAQALVADQGSAGGAAGATGGAAPKARRGRRPVGN